MASFFRSADGANGVLLPGRRRHRHTADAAQPRVPRYETRFAGESRNARDGRFLVASSPGEAPPAVWNDEKEKGPAMGQRRRGLSRGGPRCRCPRRPGRCPGLAGRGRRALPGVPRSRRRRGAGADDGASGKRLLYGCVDWSERRDHFAGPLAVAMLNAFVARGWLRRRADSRVLDVTPAGQAGLVGSLLR